MQMGLRNTKLLNAQSLQDLIISFLGDALMLPLQLMIRLETEFIDEIVRDTSSRLDLCLQSKIPHLIGMRSLVDTVTSWLKDGSSHTADILTIWGMGGDWKDISGKIYLSTAFL